MNMADKLSELESHGYKVRYAIPSEAFQYGRIPSWKVTNYRECDEDRPFIELSDAADDEGYEYVAFWRRSNFRSLERDYPGLFIRVGYGRTDALGMFVHSATADQIELACSMVDSAIYDESDWSELESEEIHDSLSNWLHSDTYRELPDWWQDIDLEFEDSAIEARFWELLDEYDPDRTIVECRDAEVVWDMPRATEVLIAALRSLKRESLGRV